jgi:hypothetical protein
MRRVIVDQMEALAELNRIVARHGRNLDTVPTAAARQEPARPVAQRAEMAVPAPLSAAATRTQSKPVGPAERLERRTSERSRRPERRRPGPRRLALRAADARLARRRGGCAAGRSDFLAAAAGRAPSARR